MNTATAPSTSGPRCHSGLPPRSFGSSQVADVLHERLQLIVRRARRCRTGHVARDHHAPLPRSPSASPDAATALRGAATHRRHRTTSDRPRTASGTACRLRRCSPLRVDLGDRWPVATGERDDVVDERVPDLRRVERLVAAHFGVGRRQRHAAGRQVVVDEAGARAAQVGSEIGAARVGAVTRRAVAQVDLLHVGCRPRPGPRRGSRPTARRRRCTGTRPLRPRSSRRATTAPAARCVRPNRSPRSSADLAPTWPFCDVGGARGTDAPALPRRASVNHGCGPLPMAPRPSAAY